MTNTDVQQVRRMYLEDLIDTFHRSHHGDYDDYYDEFFAEYLGEDAIAAGSVIPRFASMWEDETYGMIWLFETLSEALMHQSTNNNGDTLNVPAGVVDLNLGKRIQTRNVTLTEEAYHVLCGLVQPSTDVTASGIFSGCWDELRATFPIDDFIKWAKIEGRYDEDSGL